MTGSVTAFALLREGLTRILDTVGMTALMVLLVAVMLGAGSGFEGAAIAIGAIGTAACLLASPANRATPLALFAYCGLGLLSAAVNWQAPPDLENRSALLLRLWSAPQFFGLLLMGFGGGYLLRTKARLSILVALFVLTACVLAAQLAFDRTVTAFVFDYAGSTSLPSVSQWGGLHQVGLLLAMGLAGVLATAVTRPTAARLLGATTIAFCVTVAGILNASRSGLAVMFAIWAAAGVILAVRSASGGPIKWLVRSAVVLAGPVLLAVVLYSGRTNVRPIQSLTGDREPIWRAAWQMTADHPWFGVGPGHYMRQMLLDGYAARFIPKFPESTSGIEQAHNWYLQTSAETGIPALLALVWLWGWIARAGWRAARLPGSEVAVTALLLILVTFAARSMADNFLDGLVTTDRTRALFWILIGAMVAAARWAGPTTRAAAAT